MQRHIARLGAGEFFGGVTRRVETAGLLLSETVHRPHQIIPSHEHEPAHFCLGLDGACTERIRGAELECTPGTAEFHPAGTRHSSKWAASGGRCFTITLGGGWLARLGDGSSPSPNVGVLDPASRDLMTRLHRELVAFDASSPMVIEGLALALLGVSGRRRRSGRQAKPAWLPVAADYLRSNYTRPVRVDAVAAAACVPAVKLSRLFRREYGCTIGEYVRSLRVEHAARLLATSRQSVTEIALASGFVDHAHLTRTFRRLKQVTPSAYRLLLGS